MQSDPLAAHQITDRAKKLYEALFKRASETTERDYEAICLAWQDYIEADSVWLWLGHEEADDRTWHLVGHSSRPGRNVPEPTACWHPASKNRSVVEYCARKKEAVFVAEPGTWTKNLDGTDFSVQSIDALKKMGCSSFITIPLIVMEDHAEDGVSHEDNHLLIGKEVVVGAICLHFQKRIIVPDEIEDGSGPLVGIYPSSDDAPRLASRKVTLEWMGRFTAQALDRSREAIQRRTLLRLNEMAGTWLVASSRSPIDARRAYLDELTEFIQKNFNIEGISIFYRDHQKSGRVFLLHTTGLCLGEKPDEILPENLWPSLTYSIGDNSRTAQCFETGLPMPLNDGIDTSEKDVSSPKSFEVRPKTHFNELAKDWTDPALLLPIPLPPSETQSGASGSSLGVMRFAYHSWPRFAQHNRPFDPVEIQTLIFLVQQIGPVLETMARNIEVEIDISNQRHELRNNLRMINQLVEEMTAGKSNPKADQKWEVLAYNLWDLKFAGMLARNQVQRLYRDEQEHRELEIEDIYLYGKIVARLCDVVGRHAAKEKSMKLNLDHHSFAGMPKLFVDRWYVEQSLLNLLLNAEKYGNDNSAINVWALQDSHGFYICVKNEGIGIKPEDQERIFEPGVRTAEAEESAAGQGLGLHISRMMMRRHGGDVHLKSATTSSTIFALFFPLSRRFSCPSL